MRDAGSHSGTCDPADCCCQSGHCPGMKKESPISLETGCTAYLAVLFQTRISGLSASAASQHLSRMKSEGLIEGARGQIYTVIFHCQSGMRTENSAEKLIASVYPAKTLIMQGGLNALKAAGYPVTTDRLQPLPLMRQVQMTAGATGWCGMAKLLAVMPWNIQKK